MAKLLRKVYNASFYEDATYRYGVSFDTPYYFANKNDLALVIKMNIGFLEDIDEESLREALKCIKKRFPYYFGRIEKVGNNYDMVGPFDDEIVLYKNREIECLGTKETNYYYIAFSYNKNILYMYFFHGLLDGRNYMKLFKTLLYYYYLHKNKKEGGNEEIKIDGVYLLQDNISDEEFIDNRIPYFENNKINKAYVNKSEFSIQFNIFPHKTDKKYDYVFRLKESELIPFVKSTGFSPATYFNMQLGRTLYRLYKGRIGLFGKISINQYVDTSSILGITKDHGNGIDQVSIIYRKEYENMTTSELGPIYRNKIKNMTNVDSIRSMVNLQHFLVDIISKLPFWLKIVVCRFSVNVFYYLTAIGSVSYVGRNDFGTLNEKVKFMFTEMNFTTQKHMIEIDNAGGYLYVAFLNSVSKDESDKDNYVNYFIDLLEKDGINCEFITKNEFIKTKVKFA